MKSVNPVKVWRWLIAGIVFMLISIPTIFQWVPPNSHWGFRTAKTFSNEQIWYAANRASGIGLLLAGLAIVIGTIVTARLVRWNPRQANRICFAIFLVSSLAALAHGFWALSRM
ncbi:MAG: SdpI family protein [Acidobacteriota bacterium]|nr:SdpI family protein [Acidobacteriota bacterium]